MKIKYSQVIYYTHFGPEFQHRWKVLLHLGEPFVTLESAIKYVRNNYSFNYDRIGLATFEQMERGNAEWDNL